MHAVTLNEQHRLACPDYGKVHLIIYAVGCGQEIIVPFPFHRIAVLDPYGVALTASRCEL